jgi:hypothetical protein
MYPQVQSATAGLPRRPIPSVAPSVGCAWVKAQFDELAADAGVLKFGKHFVGQVSGQIHD